MDENNYRETYREINNIPCVFEKAILQQCCSCRRARHFNLAERIGVACTSNRAQQQCAQFLDVMQEKSRFALQLPTAPDIDLPHAKKIKIQCGGVIGMHVDLGGDNDPKDVDALLEQLVVKYGALDSLPYEQIVRSVVKFEGRKRRGRK